MHEEYRPKGRHTPARLLGMRFVDNTDKLPSPRSGPNPCLSDLILSLASVFALACGSSNSSEPGDQTGGAMNGAGGAIPETGGSGTGAGPSSGGAAPGGAPAGAGTSLSGGTAGSGGRPVQTGGAGTGTGAGGITAGVRGDGGSAPSGGTAGSTTGGAAGRSAGGRASTGGAAGSSTGDRASTGGTAGSSSGGTGATGAGGAGTGGNNDWPQCYAEGKVPAADAQLQQRAASGDYASQYTFGGLAMLIGPDRPSCLTDDVIQTDLEELNQGVKDVVEVLGFPAFPDWANGYYLNWVILNSGIPGATNSGEGGHQGDRWGHMNFESTEQCPCTWDEYNSGAALHECIHALQAELWAFNNPASGWVHEAHNCYLGTMREQLAHNEHTMGYGAAAALQMPHVPIESMGLNTDDSVAGPADQNAKTYVNSIVRYGLEIFFLSLNLEMGRGFINCIWMDAAEAGDAARRTSSRKSVFQALQSHGGEEAAAHAVLSFGARSAILDYGDWAEVVRSTMKSNWNNDYWFYMFPDGDGTTEFSPPTKLIPHHQGRNIIPIEVADGATSVSVELTPDAQGDGGTPERMQGQLVYRDANDKPVYGAAFSSGHSSIDLPNGVRNGIVNFVVAVTNPSAESGGDDGSGKGFDAQEHFNYRARIVSGGTIAASSVRPW